MPISVRKDKSKDLTIYTVTGVLTFNDAMPLVKDFYDSNPTRHVIWDMTDTEDVKFTSKEIESIAVYGPRIKGKRELGKTAFVAYKNLFYGLSRMFQAHSSIENSPYPVMVYRNIEEAYKWLDEADT